MKLIHTYLTFLLSLSILWANAQQGDTLEIQRNEKGNITFARFKNSESRKLKDGTLFLHEVLKETPGNDFKLVKEDTDKLGIIHLRYQQYFNGVRILGAAFLLHGRNGNIETMNGHYANVSLTSVKPVLDEDQALTKSLHFVNAKKYKWQDPAMEQFAKQNSGDPNATYYPKGELVIVRDSLNNFQLAWKFTISTFEPNDELLVIINAITGDLIIKRTLILDNNVSCTAQTMYSSNQNITGDTYTGGIRLMEDRNGINVHTLNLNHTFNYTGAGEFSNNSTNWTPGNWANINQDQAALDVHWAAEKVIDFWGSPIFNRNSIDDGGIRVLSYVHAGNQLANAKWVPGNNNHFMYYGDGDGSTTGPYVALDISAHEFGHGINEFSSNLGATTNGYQEEDALNEGLSDIWSVCVKNFAAPSKPLWLSGGEILLTSTFNCIRDIQSPKSIYAKEGQHPNTYHGQFWSSSGEPHFNSTVLSHWFYLLVEGGSGTNDNSDTYNVSGIGISEAEQIVYQAETHYLQSGDGYSDARNAMVTAATDLFCANSPEVMAVTNAWYAVGVGAIYNQLNLMSISGLPYICTSGTYSVIHQPTGITSTVWSISNPSVATITTSGVASKVSNGSVYIYADMTGTSGCTTKLSTISIPVGITPVTLKDSATPRFNGSYQTWVLSAVPDYFGTNWYWTVSYLGANAQINIFSPNASTTFADVKGGGQVSLTYTDACGNALSAGATIYSMCHSGYGAINYTVAPNPAQNDITVSAITNSNLTNAKTKTISPPNLIYGIKITNALGILKKSVEYKSGIRSIKISVAGLNAGTYTLSVFDGQQWQSQTIIIQK
jgi:Zn-dependent metalloprotease